MSSASIVSTALKRPSPLLRRAGVARGVSLGAATSAVGIEGAFHNPAAKDVPTAAVRALSTTAAAAGVSDMSSPSSSSRGKVGGYNFASSGYASCFSNLPVPDTDALRSAALKYLDEFDVRRWYDDPVTTILRGEKLVSPPSNLWITKDALGKSNGHQYLATEGQVKQLEEHIRTYVSPYRDIRAPLRRIEHRLLTDHAGLLIGNQCLDFQKQDGVTEMEESAMANRVERSLNDLLLEDEKSGKIDIDRRPIYVSCVSNFTNFLDLFRKTVRNLELGVPCAVLGRSNTVQHSYRWTELLCDLLKEEGIDAGMVTYLSCTLEDIVRVTTGCRDRTGTLYATSSRELAASIKSGYPDTVASTGGPNTLLATRWTRGVQDAIRTSATIECAGQCTALRHAVVPDTVDADDVEGMFDSAGGVADAPRALRGGVFDGIFEGHGGSKVPPVAGDGGEGGEDGGCGEYTKHGTNDVYYKLGTGASMPPDSMDEYWRKAVVDVTPLAPSSPSDVGRVDALARWLIRNQPISLGINAPRSDSLPLGRELFERTGLVVYTIGSTDDDSAPPALTCQARPQEGEVFGEFPPRKSLGKYTKFPVVVPSSTPSYGSSYRREHLEGLSASDIEDGGEGGESGGMGYVRRAIEAVSDPSVRGYCVEIVRYLCDATSHNPKRGFGKSRTAVWGLERPPLLDGAVTCVRCGGSDVTYDDILPVLIPFYVTNARGQVELSVRPDMEGGEALKGVNGAGIGAAVPITVETDGEHEARVEAHPDKFYNVVPVKKGMLDEFPMVGQFVSLYLPLGHVKSTKSDDEEFVDYFARSEKWLKMYGST